ATRPPGADTARPSGADATRPAGADTAWPAGPPYALPTEGEVSGALRQALAGVLRNVVLPYLTELGERWERGTASIDQEHFASSDNRGRLAGLARGWGNGEGPRA